MARRRDDGGGGSGLWVLAGLGLLAWLARDWWGAGSPPATASSAASPRRLPGPEPDYCGGRTCVWLGPGPQQATYQGSPVSLADIQALGESRHIRFVIARGVSAGFVTQAFDRVDDYDSVEGPGW